MRYNSKLVFWWDIIIIIFSLYNSFTVPLGFAFEDFDKNFKRITNPDGTKTMGNQYILTLLIEYVYLFDLVLRFFISFMDVGNGDEIFSQKKIALNYL